MKPNKKKPRTRNRPRNKANRQKLFESQSKEGSSTNGFNNDANVNVSSESEDDDMPGLEDECDTKKSKLFYIPEEDEAIKRIQQFMSDKKLKHQLMYGKTESLTVSETPNPKKNQVTPITSVNNSSNAKVDVIENTQTKPLETSKANDADDKATESVTPERGIDMDKAAKDKYEKLQTPTKKKNIDKVLKAVATKTATTTTPTPITTTPTKTTQLKETTTAKINKDEMVATCSLATPSPCAQPVTSAQAATKRANKNKENSKELKTNASANQNSSSKSKGKPGDSNNPEQSAFIQNIQKKMEAMMANGDETLPNNLMENLKKLLDQGPISDIESDDDGDEYVEYIYKPRKYFFVALCNLCKCDLTHLPIECSKCHMTYYCSVEHMQNDAEHRQLCGALQQVAASEDGHIFQKCADMSADQFRSYRIITIRKVEARLHRPLTATEQEVILFPHLCMNAKCRQYQFDALKNCPNCGMVAYCAQQPEHLSDNHVNWCSSYQLFKEFVIFQEQFGRLDPSLPTKILRDIPLNCNTTKQIFCKLGFDLPFNCEYAALTQISTAPLTAWYAMKLCEQINLHQDLTIHLIGAEIEFEVDVLHKWELFFLHITPTVKNLNVVFVGPELNPNNILLEQFQKTKCCIGCRKNNRSVKYFFESRTYHDYSRSQSFSRPNLICFFNAGLYRSTGYNMEDTWPETIVAASDLNVPIVVTAYTEYESPLDMQRFVEEAQRKLKVIQNPVENPFASVKPERNFISDHEAPLMFKNFFFFVIE